MDKAIVARALRALEEIGAVRSPGTGPSERNSSGDIESRPSLRRSTPSQIVGELDQMAPCGSPHCAGCYEVGEGKKIHPPKIGKAYRQWTDKWASRKVQ